MGPVGRQERDRQQAFGLQLMALYKQSWSKSTRSVEVVQDAGRTNQFNATRQSRSNALRKTQGMPPAGPRELSVSWFLSVVLLPDT